MLNKSIYKEKKRGNGRSQYKQAGLFVRPYKNVESIAADDGRRSGGTQATAHGRI